MKAFLIKSTILTLIVLLIGTVVYSTFLKQYYHFLLPLTLLFFYCATNLVHAYLLKVAVSSGTRFSSKYMAINFIKMFFYLIIAVVVVMLNRDIAKVFLANFLLGYLIFSTFEVVHLSKFIRQKKD